MNIQTTLFKIARLAPHRIPEIQTSGGCFSIDETVKGSKFSRITDNLQDLLLDYLFFLNQQSQPETPQQSNRKAVRVYSTRKSVI